MTSRDQIAGEVRELLAQTMGVGSSQITNGFDQASCPAWSSLTHLMLVSELEARYNVVFSNQEIADLTSYEKLVDALHSRGVSGA
jgi:acyl carrier protein